MKAVGDYTFLISTDLHALLIEHCRQLNVKISRALVKGKDKMTRLHFEELRDLLEEIISKKE